MEIQNNDNFDLIEAVNEFRIDEPDKLVESIRNSSKQVIHLDKL